MTKPSGDPDRSAPVLGAAETGKSRSASEREQLEELVPFLADDEVLTTDWKVLKRDDLMSQGDQGATAKIVTVLDTDDRWQNGGRGQWLNPSSNAEGMPSWSEELSRRKSAVAGCSSHVGNESRPIRPLLDC